MQSPYAKENGSIWIIKIQEVMITPATVNGGQNILPGTQPDAPAQLYNLEADLGERNNLYYKYPGIVKELKEKLEELMKKGRSRA
jgi:hypothetical protein